MRAAFTLIELSIVLVILGLLAGSVLAGQALIRASELRSIATDADRYKTAVNSFRIKYAALPGDMPRATDFWGTDPNGCPSNTVQTPRRETCDGDGNGKIGVKNSISDVAGMNEAYRAMQQLADAELIAGKYSGVTGPGGTTPPASDSIPGVNIPPSKIANVGWGIYYVEPDPTYAAGVTLLPFVYGENYNILTIGNEGDKAGMNDGTFLAEEDAVNLDTKMDDGQPLSGNVRGYFYNGNYGAITPCAVTNAAGDFVYDMTNKNPAACGLNFILD